MYQVEQFELSVFLTFRALYFIDLYIHLNTVCLCVQEQSLNWKENENVGAKEGFLIDFPTTVKTSLLE